MQEHDTDAGSGGLSRRDLLQRAGAAGLVLSFPALGASIARAGTAQSTINVLTWETYHDPISGAEDTGLKFNAVRADLSAGIAKARAARHLDLSCRPGLSPQEGRPNRAS
jgi:spermidine/putrescine-binding protein